MRFQKNGWDKFLKPPERFLTAETTKTLWGVLEVSGLGGATQALH